MVSRVSASGNNDKVLLQHNSWTSNVVEMTLEFFKPIGVALKKVGAIQFAMDVTKSVAVEAMSYKTVQ